MRTTTTAVSLLVFCVLRGVSIAGVEEAVPLLDVPQDQVAPLAEAASPVKQGKVNVVVVAQPHWASEGKVETVVCDLLADVLVVALANDRDVTVVERRRLDAVLAEQRLLIANLHDPATSTRIGKLLTADIVVSGSVFASNDKYRCVYQAIAVEGGEVLGSVEIERPRDELDGLVNELSAKLSDVIGEPLPLIAAESLDDSPVGRLHLMRGIGFYYANNPEAAIVSSLRAVRLDPRLQEARLWIARSYLQLGEYQHARAELELLRRNPAVVVLRPELEKLLAACDQAAAKAASLNTESQP